MENPRSYCVLIKGNHLLDERGDNHRYYLIAYSDSLPNSYIEVNDPRWKVYW